MKFWQFSPIFCYRRFAQSLAQCLTEFLFFLQRNSAHSSAQLSEKMKVCTKSPSQFSKNTSKHCKKCGNDYALMIFRGNRQQLFFLLHFEIKWWS